jgi:hypothetical protein
MAERTNPTGKDDLLLSRNTPRVRFLSGRNTITNYQVKEPKTPDWSCQARLHPSHWHKNNLSAQVENRPSTSNRSILDWTLGSGTNIRDSEF